MLTADTTDNFDSLDQGKRLITLAQRLALGTRLTELREQKGLSQLEVARQALGFTVSHAAVSRLERGVFGVIDNERLDKLAAFYDTTIDALLSEMEGRSDSEEPEEYRSTENLVVQPGVAGRLFNMRQAMSLTKLEMANHLGHVSDHTWHSWEKGLATPRPDTLLEIAIACGVSAAWLITGRRAKPQAPVFSMRLRAMQKMYDLDNRELALLAGMDLENGRGTIARMSRTRRQPSLEIVQSIAKAMDVPVEWLCPPEAGYTELDNKEELPAVAAVAPRKSPGERFADELRELFDSGVFDESDIKAMRSRFMKELMGKARKPESLVPGQAVARAPRGKKVVLSQPSC